MAFAAEEIKNKAKLSLNQVWEIALAEHGKKFIWDRRERKGSLKELCNIVSITVVMRHVVTIPEYIKIDQTQYIGLH